MNIRDFFYRLIGVSGILFSVNVLYYLYQLVLNHGLSPSAYGDMTSIIAWTVLASIPSVALGIFVTRYITLHIGDKEKQQGFARAILSRMLRLSILILPIILIGYWIAPYMRLSWLSYTAIISTVILMLFLGFFRSIAYVDGRLGLYTVNVAFEIVFRIVVTWVLFTYTQSIPILYLVYFLSIFLALCFFAGDIRALIVGRGKWTFSHDEVRDMRQHILPMVFFSCFVTSVGSIELVMARRILSSEDLGYLSALIVVSKIVLAGLSIWPAVAMPYFAQTRRHLKALVVIYAGLLLSMLIAFIVFRVFGDRIVSLLFPPGYAHIVGYMMPVISAMLIAALMGMVIQHAVIAGQKIAGYLSIVLPLSIVGVLSLTDGTLLATTDGLLIAYGIGASIWASLFLILSYRKTAGR